MIQTVLVALIIIVGIFFVSHGIDMWVANKTNTQPLLNIIIGVELELTALVYIGMYIL